MNKLIEMLKADRAYFQQCMFRAVEYDSSDALLTYYSNILTYIDLLIARVDAFINGGSN